MWLSRHRLTLSVEPPTTELCGYAKRFTVTNCFLYWCLSIPFCPVYLTTNIKWFSIYLHKTIGLFREKFLIYIILTTRKRAIFSISSLFKFKTSYYRPSITEQTSKNQALKANYPSLRFYNTYLTVLPPCLLKSVMFSNYKYFPKNNWTIKASELSSQFPECKTSAQEVKITCPIPQRESWNSCVAAFSPTLGSLEHHSYTVKFLVRKADFKLCLQGQNALVLESVLQAQFYPGLTSCTASLCSPPSTPSGTVPAVSRYSFSSYMVYFPFFLNSKGINTFALLPESHLPPWGKTSSSLPLLGCSRWRKNRNNSCNWLHSPTSLAPRRRRTKLWCLYKMAPQWLSCPWGLWPYCTSSLRRHTFTLLPGCEQYIKSKITMFGCFCTYAFLPYGSQSTPNHFAF